MQMAPKTTGTFNWYLDNSRILIKENGEDMVFAIADGALYRLSGPGAAVEGPFTEGPGMAREGWQYLIL